MVTLFVGASQKPFYIHVDLLCNASSFFKAAFTGDFKESSDKTMQLPEDDENLFSLFIDWLYHQRYEMLPEPDDDEDSDDDNDDIYVGEDDSNRFHQVFRLFVLAEKYDVPNLKWLLTKTLFADMDICRDGPAGVSLSYLYGHTTRSAGIRRLVADWHAWRMDRVYFERPKFRALLEELPEFSADINLSYGKNLEKGSDYNPFAGAMPDEYNRW